MKQVKCLLACLLLLIGMTACKEREASCEHQVREIAHSYTCTEAGTVTYRCDLCAEEWTEDAPAACEFPTEPSTVQGSFEYYICVHCGTVKVVNEDGLPVVPVG